MMRSPFPGMDPFIEVSGLWEDFHNSLVQGIDQELSRSIPDRYVVRTSERRYTVLSSGDEEYPALANVVVVRPRRKKARRGQTAAGVQVLEAKPAPVTMQALVETEFRETFLEIREVHPRRRLVTCIEVLSPSNKRFDTPGWSQYIRKRQIYLGGMAHFVEIDLLRGGRRMPMESDWPDSPYYLLLCRKTEAPRCTVWPASFTRPLPEIPIPLAGTDPDVPLAIQPLVEAIYARSHYERDIDYRLPIRPPLSPNESAWLRKRLRDWKKRRS